MWQIPIDDVVYTMRSGMYLYIVIFQLEKAFLTVCNEKQYIWFKLNEYFCSKHCYRHNFLVWKFSCERKFQKQLMGKGMEVMKLERVEVGGHAEIYMGHNLFRSNFRRPNLPIFYR
jgi:hypothetical protein